jgi:uncharacterized membrane protein
MALIVIAVVFLLVDVALRRDWKWAIRLARNWALVKPDVFRYLRRSPATFSYLVVLSVTTWVLVGSSDRVTNLLLAEYSTNLHQLKINPVKVLIRSAFWAPGSAFLAWVLLFALILAPAESWLGTRRWIVIFASGHVLATIGSAIALWFAIRYGWAAKSLQHTIDVGVSYGFASVAAVFTFRLPARWRWPWAASVLGIGVVALLVGQNFDDVGHLLAIAIGFAFYPITKGVAVRTRHATPIWSVKASRDTG